MNIDERRKSCNEYVNNKFIKDKDLMNEKEKNIEE